MSDEKRWPREIAAVTVRRTTHDACLANWDHRGVRVHSTEQKNEGWSKRMMDGMLTTRSQRLED